MTVDNSVDAAAACGRQGNEAPQVDRQGPGGLVSELVGSTDTHSPTHIKWSDAGLISLYRAILGSCNWYSDRSRFGLPEAVSTLPVRLVVVLYLRYEKGLTRKAIGELLPNGIRVERFRGRVGVTTARVRQMEVKALRLMRHPDRTRMFTYRIPNYQRSGSTMEDIAKTYVELSCRFKRDWQGSSADYNAMVLGFR